MLDGVHIGATWRIRLNCLCAAAMRPFCHITRYYTANTVVQLVGPLVIIIIIVDHIIVDHFTDAGTSISPLCLSICLSGQQLLN